MNAKQDAIGSEDSIVMSNRSEHLDSICSDKANPDLNMTGALNSAVSFQLDQGGTERKGQTRNSTTGANMWRT